jgi:ParB family chromosome partitioning protein
MRDVLNVQSTLLHGPTIDPSLIDCSDRLRALDEAAVQAMAAAMSERGQLQSIIVRRNPDGSNRPRLVAGRHRVAAALLLGWPEMRVEWRELTDQEARLEEIDENLIRAELTALDRAVFLAERKRVYEELHPETGHGGDRKRKPKTVEDQVANLATWSRYSKDAAAKTGLSERAVQRAVELVSKLAPAVIDELRRSPIADNQAQLLALADLPEAEQKTCAGALAGGKAKNVEAARIATELVAPRVVDPDEVAVSRCIAIFERASAKARKRIFQYISLEQKGGPSKPSSRSKGGPA